MKNITRFVVIITLVSLMASCSGSVVTTTTPTSNSTFSSTSTATGLVDTTTSAVVAFDFDSGLPALSAGKGTPFDQESNGITAHFNSPSDPAVFSVQNRDTTFLTLSQFGGNYLYQSSLSMTKLYIGFNQPLTSLELSFATVDSHGVGEVDLLTSIKVTAYLDSIDAPAVGSATARGEITSDSYPQGTLSFNSKNHAFNMVTIELLPQLRGATVFLVDNIIVTF